MTKRVLIIGGYGHFGSIIATALAQDANIHLLIGGRSLDKAKKFIEGLSAAVPPEPVALDIHDDLSSVLAEVKPDIVIHAVGPFQHQGYGVVEACLRQGCHYIDLADARSYVAGIDHYNAMAKEANLLVVSGASSVPCLTAAIIDHYRDHFSILEKVEYGISAAQQTNRGLATASGVLSYVGEPFSTLVNGTEKKIYGWQGLHAHHYPELGWRLLGNCDIPDLGLFPLRYPQLQTLRFSAGTEIPVLHLGLWLMSWVIRTGIIPPIEFMAPFLLKVSRLFDIFSRKRSGFHMLMSGTGKNGERKLEKFYMIARSGQGVQIPCVPAVLLAKGLAGGAITATGARPCLDLIDLNTYCDALKGFDISIIKYDRVLPTEPAAAPKAPRMPKPAAKSSTKPGTPPAESSVAAYTYKQDPGIPAFPDDKPLFIFDGVCVLCSSGPAWLMRIKKADAFRFATAQSPLGQALYRHYGLKMDDTYLLLDQGVMYNKSDGYLHMLGIVGGAWTHLKILSHIPRKVRDAVYDVVARNRYKWFGKVEYCELIPDELKKEMLE